MKCFFAGGGFASVGNAEVLIDSLLFVVVVVVVVIVRATTSTSLSLPREDRIRCRDVCFKLEAFLLVRLRGEAETGECALCLVVAIKDDVIIISSSSITRVPN